MSTQHEQERSRSMRPEGIDPKNVDEQGRRQMADAVSDPDSVDMNRPIGFGEAGHGAAPGGEPVAEPGDEPSAGSVPPPGTDQGGYTDGPPAFHEQPPK